MEKDESNSHRGAGEKKNIVRKEEDLRGRNIKRRGHVSIKKAEQGE